MYTLVSAIAKSFTSEGRWEDADIGSMLLIDIYNKYLNVYATLSNPFLTHNVSLDMSTMATQLAGLAVTFNDWLASLGNASLPTSDTLPILEPVFAEYRDATYAGYSIIPVTATSAPDADLPPEDKTWLYLQKTGVDYDLFFKSCMVTVNGYFHQLDGNSQGIWVMDGMLSRNVSNCCNLGITSFRKLGSIQYIPIKTEMLYRQSPDQLYRESVDINVGVDMTNKTVMLVLGGYLHVKDSKTFALTGPQTLRVDWANLPFIERYHESRQYLDFSGLPFQTTTNNPSTIDTNDFLSDANIAAYCTMSQSFIVLLDNTEVYVDRDYLEIPPFPGAAIAYQTPVYPMINGVGKAADYWPSFEDNQWSLRVVDNFRHNRLYWTRTPEESPALSDARTPELAFNLSRAFFLKIGCDINFTPATA